MPIAFLDREDDRQGNITFQGGPFDGQTRYERWPVDAIDIKLISGKCTQVGNTYTFEGASYTVPDENGVATFIGIC